MAIYLIRHGETLGNRHRVLQTPDVPLSDTGQEQARRLGARLAGAGISHIVSSDFARAAMTAEAVRLATGAALAFDTGLHERSFGDLRGRAYADLDVNPFEDGYEPPNGESWDRFHERVAATWPRVERAAAEASGHLAVVTHGLVCRAVVNHHAEHDATPDELARWQNTSLTVLDGPSPWRATLLNCVVHLDGLDETEGGAA